MRMRKKKHGEERIAACDSLLIPQPTAPIEDPNAYFGEKRPLHLEIGCGKGDFACGMAEQHPDVNFIAMERVSDVACIALEKAMACAQQRPDNLRFMIQDARQLTELFAPHTFSRIYLNFSDPWPKSGYYKRRLTYRTFLEAYRTLLCEGGELHFKTDNQGLFEFSLEEFEAAGLTVLQKTDDLHHSPMAVGNVMTEYERNFSSQGMPIHAAWVKF